MKLLALFAALSLLPAVSAFADVTIEKSEAGAIIKIDGSLFTEYVTRSGTKPVLYPIIGPTGKRMTRDYPMAKTASESADHPHHRSLWFSYDKVNDINFWAEPGNLSGGKQPSAADMAKLGVQQHRSFAKLEGGKDKGLLVAVTDWVTNDGKKVLEDERRITFSGTAGTRTIDFDIDLHATESDVHFGDSKEGVFGVRVPSSMDVDQKGRSGGEKGRIITSEGLKDAGAWGKPAAWVDYQGKVDGEQLGIAILNHPSSFRFPTPWHVRTYGLFAANPFGLQAFDKDAKPGDHTLAKGDTLKFRYRIIFHSGDEKKAQLATAFAAYATEAK